MFIRLEPSHYQDYIIIHQIKISTGLRKIQITVSTSK